MMKTRRFVIGRPGPTPRSKARKASKRPDPRTPDPDLRQLLQDYLAEKAPTLRPKSLESYQTALRTVLEPFLRAERLRYPDQVTPAHLARLSSQLQARVGPHGKPLATDTVRSYLRHIDHFWAWLEERGKLERPLRNPKPRASYKIAKILSPQQLQALQNAMPDERDRLILQVLSETGIRVGELVRLDVRDLGAEPGYRRYWLTVRSEQGTEGRGGSKNHRDREVPISAVLHRRLHDYVRHLRSQDTMSEALFLNKWRSRTSGRYEPVRIDSVQHLVKRAARRAGIEAKDYPKLGPHLLRKSYATMAADRGMHPERLRQIMGHSTTRQLGTYVQWQSQDLHGEAMRVLYEDKRG